MIKTMKLILIVSSLLFLAAPSTYAHCGKKHFVRQAYAEEGTSKKSEGEVVNKVCPVMGTKIDKDTPYRVEYKGKTIGFCCPACIKTFKANPEKYIDKVEGLGETTSSDSSALGE